MNADSYTVWFKIFGDSNYNNSVAKSVDVSIAKLPVNIAWSGADDVIMYDGTVKSVSATVSNKVLNDVVNLTLGGDFSATERGKYTATVATVDNENYTLTGGTNLSKEWIIFSNVANYTAPTAVSGLVYNAKNQKLVSAGTTTDGEMQYSLDGENFLAELPEGLNAGEYDVWFRVVGDYLETEPVKITSVIGKAKPLGNLGDKVSAKIRKGNLLSSANVKNEGILGVDGITVLSGSLEWVDGKKTINEECEEEMIFTPTDSNYEALQGPVSVGLYSSSSSGSVKRTYAVRFESNGGSKVSGQQVDENDTARKPEDPTKDGYSFGGWFSDKNLAEKYDFSNIVRDTLTLYAKWNDGDDDENENNKTDDDKDGKDKDGKDKDDVTDDWDNPFTDVKKPDWFYEDVKFAYENGLMFGTSTNKFSPKMPITRAMFVTILYRAAGEPEVVKGYTFDDIGDGLYYTDAIGWAKKYKIVKGISPTEFAPNRNIKREEIAAIMHRYAKHMGYDVSVGESTNILSYSDYDKISEYAIESMQYAVGSGMIVGKSESTIDPLDSATRAEIAAIIRRFVTAKR